MPRKVIFPLLALGALLVGAGLLLVSSRRTPAGRSPAPGLRGVAWLPAESAVVAGIEIAELRQQDWLWGLVNKATGSVKADSEYEAFINATGFDYTRDLDRVWLGLFGSGWKTPTTGVAEGHFARDRILDYARRQNARVHRHQGIEIHEVRTLARAPRQEEHVFAFAFLDDTHLAFGTGAEQAAMVVDCWLGRAPAVGTDEPRRAELERLVAGHQLWVVNQTAKGEPPGLARRLEVESLRALVTRWVIGVRVDEKGLELEATAYFHDPAQAEPFHAKLGAIVFLGQVALGGSSDEVPRLLRDTLENVKINRKGETLKLQVLVEPRVVSALLRTAPAGALQPGTLLPQRTD
ncbi:MAG: hypothetical protein ACE5IP_12035 [Terriglobia bacterium]